MLAALLDAPKPVEQNPLKLADIPDPAPGDREIRVRVAACGICHTDLHTVEGDLALPRLPLVPGHQVVGLVESRGRGAGRFQEGERVGLAWLHRACGECVYCRRGDENLCARAEFTGLQADGGYAEFAVADEAFAYPLPDGFSDRQAAPLLCAGVIGYRALKLSGIRPGGRLGLFGFGASAHIAIQVARHWGCEGYVFTRGAEHRRLARELGAAWTGGAGETAPEKISAGIIFAPAGPVGPGPPRALAPRGPGAAGGIALATRPPS